MTTANCHGRLSAADEVTFARESGVRRRTLPLLADLVSRPGYCARGSAPNVYAKKAAESEILEKNSLSGSYRRSGSMSVRQRTPKSIQLASGPCGDHCEAVHGLARSRIAIGSNCNCVKIGSPGRIRKQQQSAENSSVFGFRYHGIAPKVWWRQPDTVGRSAGS
jgi:hypothetical protein